MYISLKNLELPKNYTINPNNKDNLFKDIAYVKQNLGGFENLSGVTISFHEKYKEYLFHDYILPKEMAVRYDGTPFLTKILEIRNKTKYIVKSYNVIITTKEDIAVRVTLDIDDHPHVNYERKYCMPPIVSKGTFNSFRFEKLRSSLFRWNLAECYKEKIPPPEDFVLMPVFIEKE
jgi:hypothetical protein